MTSSRRRPASTGGARKRGPRGPRVDRARRTAMAALTEVRENDAYANLALPLLLRSEGLSGRDAAFTTELVYGTLRGRGLLDAVLTRCSSRPLDAVDPEVLDVLRLGAHQLLEMRVPAHAAVDETVALTRSTPGTRAAAGFVNAVLRKVGGDDVAGWTARVAPDPEVDPIGHLAVAHSHPAWIVRAFAEALAGEAATDTSIEVGPSTVSGPLAVGSPRYAELADLLEADNAPPAVALAVRPGLAGVDELVSAGAAPGRWSPFGAVLSGGDPGDIPAVAQGRAGVQDEGSQLVAAALALAPLDGRDERWLDLCAGPGGKAALLTGLANGAGARLVAVESNARRAHLVQRAVRAYPEPPEVTVGDGRDVGDAEPGGYDRVLVDAPCTGLGSLRRRPESRWRRQPADIGALAPLQRALLASAVAAVRPGGLVGYVVCSPHVAETDGPVGDAVRTGGAELVDARPVLPGVEPLGPGPTVQLWPHRHGTDAMFLALLRRR